MKCPVCDQRKGKRQCPAKGRLICTQCCGEKRIVEISCPQECPFLASGHVYQWVKDYESLLQSQNDPDSKRKIFLANRLFGDVLGEIEGVIVRFAREVRSLRDRDISDAVCTVRDTYRTESKGLIYEHQSTNLVAQALSKEIREFLEKLKQDPRPKRERVRSQDIVTLMEVVELDLRFHQSIRKSYLEKLRRYYPGGAKSEASGGLIIPGS